MTRRPAHKIAHAQCPYGVFNWSDCDAAASHRWGRCTAMVDAKPEPHTCSNWAVADDGWCGQHFIALHEKEMRKAREAARQLQLLQNIDKFLELTARGDYEWWTKLRSSAESTRGLAGVERVERPKAVLETTPPPRLTPMRVRKLPHRLG